MADTFGIELSTNVKARHLKLLFWGNTGTRKTESVLRYFPHVLLVDTEGNSDQCVDMPEIPPFLRKVTKDPREVMAIVDAVADGKIKFADGSVVDTLAIDSASVLWGVQQEVAAVNAEKRAAKYNKNVEAASMTQLDWVIAKRPMKRIYSRLSASPIKFLIMIAREKDLYKEKEGSSDLVKVGFTPDIMKGLDYDMNLVLRFAFDEAGKWSAEVTKVQGSLGAKYPKGKKLAAFPAKELIEHASKIQTSVVEEKDESTLGSEVQQTEENNAAPHTQSELIKFARDYGIQPAELGAVLKKAGVSGFDPGKWEAMMKAILDYVAANPPATNN